MIHILIITAIKLALDNNVAALNVNMICLKTNMFGGVLYIYYILIQKKTVGYGSFFK